MKITSHLKWVLPVVVLLFFVASQAPKVSSGSVSPEVYFVDNARNTKIISNFQLKIESLAPLVSVKLKARSVKGEAAPIVELKRKPGAVYSGSFEFSEDLKNPRTFVFELYIDGIKTRHNLRVAFTDANVALPADPGEAGKSTLMGVDSNNDGVRDDIEREIVFRHPESDEVRRVLRQMVKYKEKILSQPYDKSSLVDSFQKEFMLGGCYTELVFDPKLSFNEGVSQSTYWDDLFANTPNRKKEYDAKFNFTTPFGNGFPSCKVLKEMNIY